MTATRFSAQYFMGRAPHRSNKGVVDPPEVIVVTSLAFFYPVMTSCLWRFLNPKTLWGEIFLPGECSPSISFCFCFFFRRPMPPESDRLVLATAIFGSGTLFFLTQALRHLFSYAYFGAVLDSLFGGEAVGSRLVGYLYRSLCGLRSHSCCRCIFSRPPPSLVSPSFFLILCLVSSILRWEGVPRISTS